MKIKPSKFSGIATLIMISTLILSACGGSPAPDVIDPGPSSDANSPEADDSDSVPSSADDYYFIGTNLEGLDVCELIPLDAISAIVGPLREDETQAEISLAGEAGCKYVDQAGQWYYATYYPLGDWGFAEFTLSDPEKVDGLLDGAWKSSYSSDEIHIKALAADELVIGAFVSDGQEETAVSLVELLYALRPK